MSIVIINGPNLNLLGSRQPEIYGTLTLSAIIAEVEKAFPDLNIVSFQSNHEGDIIDCIQKFGNDPECSGIVINPGAFAHYSYAIADAVASVAAPTVEVHISNIMAREDFRCRSVTARSCKAMITGAGAMGYLLAVKFLNEA